MGMSLGAGYRGVQGEYGPALRQQDAVSEAGRQRRGLVTRRAGIAADVW